MFHKVSATITDSINEYAELVIDNVELKLQLIPTELDYIELISKLSVKQFKELNEFFERYKSFMPDKITLTDHTGMDNGEIHSVLLDEFTVYNMVKSISFIVKGRFDITLSLIITKTDDTDWKMGEEQGGEEFDINLIPQD